MVIHSGITPADEVSLYVDSKSFNSVLAPLLLVASLLLAVRPGAPSSFLFLVAMPGAPSSVLAQLGSPQDFLTQLSNV